MLSWKKHLLSFRSCNSLDMVAKHWWRQVLILVCQVSTYLGFISSITQTYSYDPGQDSRQNLFKILVTNIQQDIIEQYTHTFLYVHFHIQSWWIIFYIGYVYVLHVEWLSCCCSEWLYLKNASPLLLLLLLLTCSCRAIKTASATINHGQSWSDEPLSLKAPKQEGWLEFQVCSCLSLCCHRW